VKVGISRWQAWAPQQQSTADWESWAGDPRPLSSDGAPDGRFLPPMLRRRCTPLSKIMLKVAFDCCGDDERRAGVRTVFASRHGSINESIELLECVVRRERVSPAKFSHTVHNAQAGLFSIAAGNREASSSLAGREDTFGCGLLESLAHLQREPERPVLLVVGDVPLAPRFAALIQEPPASYAVALLLEANGGGPALRVDLRPASAERSAPSWPAAAEFLRFWISDDPSVEIQTPRHAWAFTKH